MQSHTTEVSGITLHSLEAGEGPPVLLLHGWPTSAHLWRHALPKIAASGRHAIALDLPGYGASDKPLSASYSFRFYDRILTGFLDARGIDRVGLAVHDIGGPIGLHWAVNNTDRVTDLALLNTLAYPDMSAMVVAFVAASYLPGARSLLSSQRGLAWAMRFGVTDKARITSEVAALYQAPFTTADARKALLKAAHGLHPKGFTTIAKGIPKLTMPLRIVYGEQDRILPNVAETMSRIAATLPHAEVTALPGGGHFLQEDRPDEVADLLAAFFEGSLSHGTHLRRAEGQGQTGAAV